MKLGVVQAHGAHILITGTVERECQQEVRGLVWSVETSLPCRNHWYEEWIHARLFAFVEED